MHSRRQPEPARLGYHSRDDVQKHPRRLLRRAQIRAVGICRVRGFQCEATVCKQTEDLAPDLFDQFEDLQNADGTHWEAGLVGRVRGLANVGYPWRLRNPIQYRFDERVDLPSLRVKFVEMVLEHGFDQPS